MRLTSALPCGRRSRVVLAPLCRRQVREDAQSVARMTGSTKRWSRGERGVSRKTIAWGMPDVSGASAVNTCVHTSLSRSAHRAAGALGTRHSPRPLIAEGGRSDAKLGRPRPRDREAMSAKQGVQPTTAFHANQSFPSTSIGLSLPLPLAGRAIAYDECPERRRRFGIVMAGLVPAIHVLRSGTKSDVDARPKAGHDDRESKSDEAKRSFAGCGRGNARGWKRWVAWIRCPAG